MERFQTACNVCSDMFIIRMIQAGIDREKMEKEDKDTDRDSDSDDLVDDSAISAIDDTVKDIGISEETMVIESEQIFIEP